MQFLEVSEPRAKHTCDEYTGTASALIHKQCLRGRHLQTDRVGRQSTGQGLCGIGLS